jgi:hypothetical protein
MVACRLARLAGFEPATYGLEVINPELPNLLTSKEVFEIPGFHLGISYPIFANFGRFWKDFLTQILTQGTSRGIVNNRRVALCVSMTGASTCDKLVSRVGKGTHSP